MSPQVFLWNDDRYYVPSYSEEKCCIVPFRVDRMRNVEIMDEDSVIDAFSMLPNTAVKC